MQESTKQIVIAVAASAAAAATAAIVTHWLTKQSTTNDIATGKTPLPAGSTPAVKSDTPGDQPPPKAPAPAPTNLVNMASQIAKTISQKQQIPKCPTGYHAVYLGQPNMPWMCAQDT
jgi:hypothetical protein